MAAQLHPDDDDNPFGRPFASSQHQSRTASSSTSAAAAGGFTSPVAPTSSVGPNVTLGVYPEGVNKFEAGAEDVNAAVLIPGQENAVLTVSNDRYVISMCVIKTVR